MNLIINVYIADTKHNKKSSSQFKFETLTYLSLFNDLKKKMHIHATLTKLLRHYQQQCRWPEFVSFSGFVHEGVIVRVVYSNKKGLLFLYSSAVTK